MIKLAHYWRRTQGFDFHKTMITDKRLNRYSKHKFAGIFFFGGLGIFPFARMLWLANDIFGVALNVSLIVAFWVLAAWAMADRRIGSGPVLMVMLLVNFVGLVTALRLYQVGIYWVYPIMMAVAYIMPWRWATPMNVANVVIVLLFAAGWMPDAHYYRLVATLLIVLTFSVMFSYNIEQQLKLLEELSVTDPLTQAFNRRYFERELDDARRHWQRTRNVASMIMIDIDNFKLINDTHGHHVGDNVLVALSNYISSELRPLDRFFRLGGEEFAILLLDTSATQAASLAERFRRHIADGSLDGKLPVFTISCGVAEYPEQRSLSEWPEQCDKALYAAKDAGRNKVVMAQK